MKVNPPYLHRCKTVTLVLLFLTSIESYANAPLLKIVPLSVNSLVYGIDDIAARPTSITLTTTSVPENEPVGTVVGTFVTVDPDAGSTHTYSLVSSLFYPDNASFSILDNQLLTKAVFNFETKSTYRIRVRSTDNDGQYLDKTFNINIKDINEAPVATNVNISRSNNRIGTTNTGTFTYSDPDKDGAGKHIYKWYRIVSFGDTIWIDSISTVTYIPVLADGGCSICFEVTPSDNEGLLGNPVKSSFQYVNAAPVAGNVYIYAPDVSINSRVYGRFTYSDLENNTAAKHTYRWYRSSTPSGKGTLISTATDTTYRLTSADDTWYIRFEIIPAASAGSTPGASVTSAWTGPIGMPPPTAVLSGTDTTCQGDTAILHVSLEGTPPFSITYLRNGSGATTISNITEFNYILKVVGDGLYTLSAVSDKYRKGRVSGSGTVVNRALPTATISGSSSICEHTNANLSITLTGTRPWRFSYHRNAEIPTTYIDVTDVTRLVSVNKAGTYTLTEVSDKYCQGTYSGSAVITVIPAPDVTISGLNSAYSDRILMVPVFGYPKGGTFIPSLMYRNDTNFFLPAIVGPGIHTIVYRYYDGGTGCYGYDTAIVAVLSANAEITFPENDTKKLFCYNEPPFTIVGYNKANSIGSFTISGGAGLVDNRDNTATIYPNQLTGGTYKLTYRYYDQTPLYVTDSFTIESIGELKIFGFDESSYCDNVAPVRLIGNADEGIFSGKAVTGNIISGYFYEPMRSVPGPDTVFYTYTSRWGCSRQIYKALIVRDAADINFTIRDSCLSATTSDSIEFFNLTTSTDPVLSWRWLFGDAISGDDSSMLENPKHLYTKEGLRSVTLKATTHYCISSKSILFTFGAEPGAEFQWATECFHEGHKIMFFRSSSSYDPEPTISEYNWKFYDGEKVDSALTEHAEYLYSKPGTYDIELFVRSSHGCTNTHRKTLVLRPTYPLSRGESYFEGFENGMAGWASASDGMVNSWTLGLPGNEFTGSGVVTQTWFTHIVKEQPDPEQSAVISPFFDFNWISKPMVKLDLWRNFDQYRDGANLQYKADTSKTWLNIGKLDDGINWYNNYEISGLPGGRSTGWSCKKEVPPDNDWIEARHSIDQLKGMKNIQFRIAYGSDDRATGTHGLAFDNFRIGERNQIVLVEHFTNTSDSASMLADAALDALTNSNPADIIDIQYHTSFPGADPFNELNKVDPGTRVLFYQLSTVPFSVVNGGVYRFDYDNKPLDDNLVKIQSLLDPKFGITLRTSILDNTLTVNAEIRSLQMMINRQVTLHIAVVERVISGITGANGDTLFESVLRSILSSNSYSGNWDPATRVETVTENWNFKNAYNADEIRVIAFVQDEATYEIYQAMIDKFDVQLALEDENTLYPGNESSEFIAFPNPLNNEVYLRFSIAPVKTLRIDLFDINGKLIMQQELPPGNNQYTIAMESYPEGFYFLKINSDNQFIGLQKLVITK